MKIKILDELSYQSYPYTDDMVEITEQELKEIGKTKKFDLKTKRVVEYINKKNVDMGKLNNIQKYKNLLIKLSEDIIQSLLGEDVPDIDNKKKLFIEIHNKLRVLEGKEERVLKNK